MGKFIISVFIALVCFLKPISIFAQSADTTGTWSLSAYADAYYALYSDSVGVGNYQKFPTVSPRNNSIGLNAVQLTAQYDGARVRATIIAHAGDIPSSSWSSKYSAIQEAHVGVKLSKKLWLDAGFFKTHFGTEYLMPKDNITSSLSMLTYYEPFYEAGLKLNYDPSKNLEINFFLLNGYNIFEDNNTKKSVGLGITYLLGDKGNIGYTNYFGDDAPVASILPQTRFANNLFLNYALSSKFLVQLGGDYFIQQNSDLITPTKVGTAYGMLGTLKFQVKPRFALYERTDMFYDPNGLLSSLYTYSNGDQLGYASVGQTVGIEFKPSSNSYIRMEYKRIQMLYNEEIFHNNGTNFDYRNELTINMGVYFDIVKGFETKK